jgi:hypothetical protein
MCSESVINPAEIGAALMLSGLVIKFSVSRPVRTRAGAHCSPLDGLPRLSVKLLFQTIRTPKTFAGRGSPKVIDDQ